MKTAYRKWLSEKLRTLRSNASFTIADVSTNLNLKASTYRAYEEGRAQPSLLVIQHICKFYKMDIDTFIEDSPLRKMYSRVK